MGELLAVLAALAFALGTVLQQKGTLTTEAGEKDPGFLIEILHKPVWLAGMVFQIVGWILQAVALDRTSLVVTQSLVSLSLVIALPLGGWLTDQHIGRRELGGALLTLTGIACFLSAGQPRGGTTHPGAATWTIACAITLGLVLVAGAIGSRRAGAEKAIALGVAAGLAFGLQAAVTKTFVTEIGGGVLALLGTWSSYVLLVTALLGFGLQQSALKTGVLAPAMASSNSVTLFTSVVLGSAVYGETIARSGGAHRGAAVVGLLVAVAGIVLLAGSTRPNPSDAAALGSST
ncbi:MAG TPA: DMT family transporter [Gaiellaceae bacterium]|jgi:drug/metabolite transporter (DMT)-like permease|nr:DMT family transporter [Gaiellaceae bacterium]